MKKSNGRDAKFCVPFFVFPVARMKISFDGKPEKTVK